MNDLHDFRKLTMPRCVGCFHILFLPLLIASLGSISAHAQAFLRLHEFANRDDGVGPRTGVVLSGNRLYGTATAGGDSGNGTVFAVKTDGSDFNTLHRFTADSSSNTGYTYTNLDGAEPKGLILSGGVLYGTTSRGGLGVGTVFAVNTDGTGFRTVHNFTGGDGGASPVCRLLLSGNTLYGTTLQGGISGNGTVFAVNIDGTGFAILHRFVGYPGDGAKPYAGLILSGNLLYGTAAVGGSSGNGTVFTLNTNGTDFTNLYSFTPTPGPYPYTNTDGANPEGGLILSGNTLYGTATDGGSSANGTVFALNVDGTGFRNLHNFSTASPYPEPYTNSDGAYPSAGLILAGDTLYGTAQRGGSSGKGTMFSIQTNGTGFATFRHFAGYPSDGDNPEVLTFSGNAIYGTAGGGGSYGAGTVFAANTDGTGFTNLYNFTVRGGGKPDGPLILVGTTLYGTAAMGRPSNAGTVFAINTTGGNYTNLHTFSTADFSFGANPIGGLSVSGKKLYGIAAGGGQGSGTVFAVNTDGTGFTDVYSFAATSISGTNSDGAGPFGGVALSGYTLYGVARTGGTSGNGTVFAVNIDGTGFTNLHNFSITAPYPGPFINSDGVNPLGGLVSSDKTLYGTAVLGGGSANGTVFAVNIDGTGFRTLHSFAGYPSEGALPYAGLILWGNTLYGTTFEGGSYGSGTVFAVNTDGTGFTNLYSFTLLNNETNSDGGGPKANLILSGRTLYGTAEQGGSSGRGTVFAVNIDGTGFATLYSFTSGIGSYPTAINSDGAYPKAGLILSGDVLYGTAPSGGDSGIGTVFSLSFAPQLTIIPSEANVILSWPTNYAGFDYTGYTLQSTTNLGSSAVWVRNSPVPVVVNGQSTVTNPLTGTQQFFRLSQ